MEIIKKYHSADDINLSGTVATGNGRHDYRAILRDEDAQKNVTVLFTNDINQAHRAAVEFTTCSPVN